MLKLFILISSLFILCSCNRTSSVLLWEKNINANKISIKRNNTFLDIFIFIPNKNLAEFDDQYSYLDLLNEAFADYLKITKDGTFKCPGVETISEKKENNGLTIQFRIPENELKVVKQ